MSLLLLNHVFHEKIVIKVSEFCSELQMPNPENRHLMNEATTCERLSEGTCIKLMTDFMSVAWLIVHANDIAIIPSQYLRGCTG